MNEQMFKRKPFTYISKFFMAVAFSFSLAVDVMTQSKEIFPMYNLLMAGLIVFALIMGFWEINNPIVKINGSTLLLQMTMLTGVKTIDLDKVEYVDINKRQTRMTLSGADNKGFIIPLNLVQNADKQLLIEVVQEKTEG